MGTRSNVLSQVDVVKYGCAAVWLARFGHPNETNSGLFQFRFQYILAQIWAHKSVLKSD